MRSHSRSTCLLLVIVAALLWSAHPIGAAPLESWDNKIPNATLRFKVLPEFNNAAVLDRETQLVWERSPSTDLRGWYQRGPNVRDGPSAGGDHGDCRRCTSWRV